MALFQVPSRALALTLPLGLCMQRRGIYQQYSGQLTSILCVLFVVFYCLVEVYMYVMKSVFFFNCL